MAFRYFDETEANKWIAIGIMVYLFVVPFLIGGLAILAWMVLR